MNIFLTGGTGFIGSYLTRRLLQSGHTVTCVGRSAKMRIDQDNLHYIQGDTSQRGPWQEAAAKADAAVNLAGVSIFKRWDEAYKKELRDSRILTTRHLVEFLPENSNTLLISTSAVGYYGERNEDILLENEGPGSDFLAALCADWEAEAGVAEKKGVRVAVARFGVVLGKGGGALAQMIPLFKWCLGGPLGSGRQWFPWIHLEDLASAMMYIMDHPDIRGPLNFTAPVSVRQKDFAKALGRQLKRPAVLPAPAFMIRLILGEMSNVLLYSQKVIPEQLAGHGFQFRFKDIQSALDNILG